MSRRRFRERLPFAPKHETDFHWRSRGSSRLESLSDAVFGFALTLLVVSNEAPRDFAGLVNVLREFPPFVACFALLMYFWNEHYRFFRRYGLEDLTTRMLNYVILLLVVFSIYPLKFLFTGWFAFMFGPQFGPTTVKYLPVNELYALYIVYGAGMAAIFAVYALLFRHAWARREELQLTAIERVQTRASIMEFLDPSCRVRALGRTRDFPRAPDSARHRLRAARAVDRLERLVAWPAVGAAARGAFD